MATIATVARDRRIGAGLGRGRHGRLRRRFRWRGRSAGRRAIGWRRCRGRGL